MGLHLECCMVAWADLGERGAVGELGLVAERGGQGGLAAERVLV